VTPTVDLAVLDMAGTTVADDGLVDTAFAAALDAAGVVPGTARDQELRAHVRDTMGQSKIEVFRAVFDEPTAQRANTAFERSYLEQIDRGAARPLPGAEAVVAALRGAGIRVALTTGFARETQDRLVRALGWGDLADLVLCPADAGRGRPHPDLVLTAVLRLGIDDVARVAVAGDTANDVLTGRRAGASVVAGVLTGAHDAATLRAAGATHVLDSVAELPDLLVPTAAATA
jgi:phosphoglycolate phosphatase